MKQWTVKTILFMMCLLPCWFSYISLLNDSPYRGIGFLCSAILIGSLFPRKAWMKALFLILLVPIIYYISPTTDGAELESKAFFFALLPITFPLMFLAIAIYTFPGVYLGVLLNFLLLQPLYKYLFHKELHI